MQVKASSQEAEAKDKKQRRKINGLKQDNHTLWLVYRSVARFHDSLCTYAVPYLYMNNESIHFGVLRFTRSDEAPEGRE